MCFYIWQVGGTLRSSQFFILNHSGNKAAYKIRPQCAEQMVKYDSAHCGAASSWLMCLQNKHDNGPCVCRRRPRFTVKSRLAQISPEEPPLDFSGDICGCSSPSSLPGSLEKGLKYVEDLWILAGGQLRSVFLQPIRGTDLVSESPDQGVQALSGLRRLAVEQH